MSDLDRQIVVTLQTFARWAAASDLRQAGKITRNQALARAGLEPTDTAYPTYLARQQRYTADKYELARYAYQRLYRNTDG